MWVRARPKAEHDALLISFVGMMYKRDIQLLLHLGIVLSMPFREAEQRLVARVIGKRVCKLMVRGQSGEMYRTYVGWTTDLDRRLAQHNAGTGARSTRGRFGFCYMPSSMRRDAKP
jgi:hypothetical protein